MKCMQFSALLKAHLFATTIVLLPILPPKAKSLVRPFTFTVCILPAPNTSKLKFLFTLFALWSRVTLSERDRVSQSTDLERRWFCKATSLCALMPHTAMAFWPEELCNISEDTGLLCWWLTAVCIPCSLSVPIRSPAASDAKKLFNEMSQTKKDHRWCSFSIWKAANFALSLVSLKNADLYCPETDVLDGMSTWLAGLS